VLGEQRRRVQRRVEIEGAVEIALGRVQQNEGIIERHAQHGQRAEHAEHRIDAPRAGVAALVGEVLHDALLEAVGLALLARDHRLRLRHAAGRSVGCLTSCPHSGHLLFRGVADRSYPHFWQSVGRSRRHLAHSHAAGTPHANAIAQSGMSNENTPSVG
jgi:hypothetical protein